MGSEDENVTTRRLTAEEIAWLEALLAYQDKKGGAFPREQVRALLAHIRALDVELERARLAVELAKADAWARGYDEGFNDAADGEDDINKRPNPYRAAKTGGRDG